MQHALSWRRWLVLVAVGELVGFAVPAAVGITASELAAGAQLAMMPIAGLFEGAALGFAQLVVLRPSWPALRGRAWVLATSLGAALAWFLGMLPSTTHDSWATWPAVWVAVTATMLGTALLATIGTAQALAMPAGTPGRLAWVGWTALGWCAGLAAFSLVAPPLWQPGQPAWLLVLIGVAGGLVMALAMAAVTGVGAVRLVDRAARVDGSGGFTPGSHLLSAVLGTPVHDAADDELGDRGQGPPVG